MVWYDCWSVMIVDAFLRSEVDRHVYLLGISFLPWICYCFFFSFYVFLALFFFLFLFSHGDSFFSCSGSQVLLIYFLRFFPRSSWYRKEVSFWAHWKEYPFRCFVSFSSGGGVRL